jgi:hypothetical protein
MARMIAVAGNGPGAAGSRVGHRNDPPAICQQLQRLPLIAAEVRASIRRPGLRGRAGRSPGSRGAAAMLRRALLLLCLSSAVAGLTVTAAAPASAGLTGGRVCRDFYTGDRHQRLSVCALFWFSDVNTQYRAVVQMHTYILVNGFWTDVRSQSITINSAIVDAFQIGSGVNYGGFNFGNDINQQLNKNTCRVNGPSGAIACSVPNTYRVDFYSVADSYTSVPNISWRDQLGAAHTVKAFDMSFPDTLPFEYYYTR